MLPNYEGEFPYIDNTKWFEWNYPGWLSTVMDCFPRTINDTIRKNCGASDILDRIEPTEHTIGITPIAKFPWGNETLWGDCAQSRFSAGCVLGHFAFVVRDIRVSYYTIERGKCCKSETAKGFIWSATVYVEDVVGRSPGDPIEMLPLIPELFCRDLRIRRAKWTISGCGTCCPEGGPPNSENPLPHAK